MDAPAYHEVHDLAQRRVRVDAVADRHQGILDQQPRVHLRVHELPDGANILNGPGRYEPLGTIGIAQRSGQAGYDVLPRPGEPTGHQDEHENPRRPRLGSGFRGQSKWLRAHPDGQRRTIQAFERREDGHDLLVDPDDLPLGAGVQLARELLPPRRLHGTLRGDAREHRIESLAEIFRPKGEDRPGVHEEFRELHVDLPR